MFILVALTPDKHTIHARYTPAKEVDNCCAVFYKVVQVLAGTLLDNIV